MKSFEIKKRGKYFQSKYIGYVAPNATIDVNNWNTMLHSTRQDVEKYIKFILDLEVELEKFMKDSKMNHNPKKVIRFYLRIIDSMTSGFDIRSSMSLKESAEMFATWFNDKYIEAKEGCEKILIGLKTNPVGYYTNYRVFDKFDYDNNMFELGIEKLDSYYTKDPLISMSEALEKMHEILDQRRLDKK